MSIEVTKNIEDEDEVKFAFEMMTRVAPVSPDFSQWECRIHVITDLGPGPEVIGEITFRSYNGGIAPLEKMLPEVFKAAKVRIQQASAMLRQMQKQADAQNDKRIVLAKDMPQ